MIFYLLIQFLDDVNGKGRARSKPGAETSSGPTKWVAGDTTLGSTLAEFSRQLAGSWFRRGAARTQTGAHMECWHAGCCIYIKRLAPKDKILVKIWKYSAYPDLFPRGL